MADDSSFLVEGEAPRSRREFLRGAALGLAVPAVAGALAACKEEGGAAVAQTRNASTRPTGVPPGAQHADSDHSGGTMAPHPSGVASTSAADEMDRHHEAGIRSFPAAARGKGNQPFAPRIENGVKIYDLTAEKLQWEVAPGQTVEA